MGEGYGCQQLEWDPVEDLKTYPLWLNDLAHVAVPWKPLAMVQFLSALQDGMKLAASKISIPGSHGWDVRIKDGHYFLALVEAKPHEIVEREAAYREYLKPFIDDLDKVWNEKMAEWLPIVEGFKERCYPEKLKELSDQELFQLLDDYDLNCHRRCWVDYFVLLYPVLDLYNLFADLCQKETGIGMEDPLFKKLLGGFDTIEFRIDRELWRLGERAKELGIEKLFLSTEDDVELMSKLRTSNECSEWLSEYEEFLTSYGWRCSGWTNVDTPSWVEKPSEALRYVKTGMAKGGHHAADAHRESLAKQREEAASEILAKVSTKEKGWFAKLMKTAMRSGWFQEEHAINTGMLDTAIGRHIFMEFGRRFAKAGVIDEQEDIFFLLVPEIKRQTIPPGGVNLRSFVNRHREEWENNKKAEKRPFLGDISLLGQQAWKDPLARIFSGMPIVKPELKADLYGASSSHGVVEGVARVIIDQADLNQIKPGEILVAVMTNALWTPIFSVISGLVTDIGGSLAHAVIVAREHGIPAVVGTHEATHKIKTGDRIRVDGDQGCVHILG
jgi:pyruvate,water dikinase